MLAKVIFIVNGSGDRCGYGFYELTRVNGELFWKSRWVHFWRRKNIWLNYWGANHQLTEKSICIMNFYVKKPNSAFSPAYIAFEDRQLNWQPYV